MNIFRHVMSTPGLVRLNVYNFYTNTKKTCFSRLLSTCSSKTRSLFFVGIFYFFFSCLYFFPPFKYICNSVWFPGIESLHQLLRGARKRFKTRIELQIISYFNFFFWCWYHKNSTHSYFSITLIVYFFRICINFYCRNGKFLFVPVRSSPELR